MKRTALLVVAVIIGCIFAYTFSAIFYTYNNAHFGIDMTKNTTPYSQDGNGNTVALLGDSSLYGTGVENNSSSVAGLIGHNCNNCQVINISSSGAKIIKLQEQIKMLPGDKLDTAIVSIGYNDVLHFYSNLKQSCELYKSAIKVLNSNASQIIIFTMPNAQHSRFYPFPFNIYYGKRSKALNSCIRTTVESSESIQLIDLESIYTKELLHKHESKDKLHMNESGNQFWYSLITKRM